MNKIMPESWNKKTKPHLFCPGCGHAIVLKQLGFVIDELKIKDKTTFGIDIGCSLLAWDFFDMDTIQTHHGRTTPVMVGYKIIKPKRVVLAYMGDGGGYAIGLQSVLHAAFRNDPITTILVHNSNYAMTGGQMAPTTRPGEITATTPEGKPSGFGNGFHGPELIRNIANKKAYIARSSVSKPLILKKVLKEALLNQINNSSYSFVEVLSVCPTNWKMNAKQSFAKLSDMENYFPVGNISGGDNEKTNIILSGEGGQGIQSIAKIIAKSAINSGLEASYMPSFGVEQRGAPSVAYVTIDKKALRYPKFDLADVAVVLQKRAALAIDNYISLNTKVIFDSSTISVKDLPKRSSIVLGVPATKYCYEKFTTKSLNVLVLGALSQIIGLDIKIVWLEVLNELGKKFKTSEVKKLNHDALIFGYEIIFEKNNFSDPVFKPKHKEILFKNSTKVGKIIPQKCKGCGICIAKCPVGAISFGEDIGYFGNPVPKIDLEKCIACGNCRNFCPDAAISVEKISENK